MNRGAGRRRVFHSDHDYDSFLEILSEITTTYHIEVHAFALMGNHYHLLLHTPQAGLGRALRHLNSVYTLRFNRRHKSDGPLFRGRYKAQLIDSENYLLSVVRYIHLNPVAASLCRNPLKYWWTSHGAYVRRTSQAPWLVTDEVLSRFGCRAQQARQAFHQYVLEGMLDGEARELETQGRIIGGQDFQKWVLRNFVEVEKKQDKEIPRAERKPRWVQGVKGIFEQVALMYDTTMIELRRRSNGRRHDARAMAVYLSRKLAGIPQKDLARWINATNEYAVAKIQQRFRDRLERDRALKKFASEAERIILSTVKT